jgi:spermidine synthase
VPLYWITFLSGFAALVYQMLWIRQLALVLGSTTAAISTVVAAFMAGLALGSGAIGAWIDRRRDPLAVYAVLEAGIGAAALAVMAALPRLGSIYPLLAAATSGSAVLLAAVRFPLAFLLLLVPTSLMGGTFPVLVKALARDGERLGATAGRLYAVNTAGAVAGCFTAGIWMLGVLGLPGAYAVAAAMNGCAALGAAAILLVTGGRAAPAPAAQPQRGLPPAASAVAWAVGISGAIALGYEIVWSRALAIVLGHSIYAFTFVLSTYLAGLALGGALAAPVLDRLKRPDRAFACGLLVLAVVSGAGIWLIPSLPIRDYTLGMSPLRYIRANLVSTTILLGPPTLILGALLPLAIRACTAGVERAGRDAGRVYAGNTLGSIAGSLLTGFVLVPRLGTERAWLALSASSAALALWVGLRARWPAGWTRAAVLSIAAAAVAFHLSAGSPVLRRKSVGRVERHLGEKVELLYYGEDEVASAGVIRRSSGREHLFTNGVLMTHWGLETSWMAHLPLAMADDPRDVLVLCLGMGNTYRAAALYPVRVTAVELSSSVVEAFRRMRGAAPGEADARIEVGDARNAALVWNRGFDVITVDPPPPLYSAGTVNFHTREFFQLLRERVRPRGVVCQWVPFRDCTADEYRSIVRTFASVFERVSVWVPNPATGAYLIGPGAELDVDPDQVRRRLGSPRVEADIRRFTPEPGEQVLPAEVMRGPAVYVFCGAAPLLDDAHPFLEFPLFRNSGRTDVMDREILSRFTEQRR